MGGDVTVNVIAPQKQEPCRGNTELSPMAGNGTSGPIVPHPCTPHLVDAHLSFEPLHGGSTA